MRRDRAWLWMTGWAACAAVLTAAGGAFLDLPARQHTREAFKGGLEFFLLFQMGFMVMLMFTLHAGRDWYEAALPIAGRDVWLSRVLSLLSLTWAPVAIGIAGGLPAPSLLN